MLALCCTTLLVPPPAVAAAPIQYRVDVRMEVAVGEQTDADYFTDLARTTGFITVTMSDTTIGRFASIRIDSTRYEGGQAEAEVRATQPALLKDPKGTLVRLLVVNGKIDTRQVAPQITPDEESLPLGSLFRGFTALFPGFRADAKVGSTWSDTTRNAAQGVGDITAWQVSTGEGDALRYVGNRSSARRTVAPDSSVMTGTETAKHDIVTSTLGPVRSVTSSSVLEGLIRGGAAGDDPVPLRTVQSITVTLLPADSTKR